MVVTYAVLRNWTNRVIRFSLKVAWMLPQWWSRGELVVATQTLKQRTGEEWCQDVEGITRSMGGNITKKSRGADEPSALRLSVQVSQPAVINQLHHRGEVSMKFCEFLTYTALS